MSQTMTPTGGWSCPSCKRRIPLRIEACRCGEPRPAEVGTGTGASQVVATSRPTSTMGSATAGSFDPSLRSPKESTLFVIGVVVSGLFWLMLVISLVGIFYGVIGLIFSLLIHAVFLGHLKGDALRVSERQLPDVHAAVVRSSRALGLETPPEVYVLQAGGTLNAFATKLLSRRVVIIYSDLLDACDDPRQLEFVIAHEVGHLAAGHLAWNAFLWPFMLVPLLGMAYSRAREYTCDLCGLAVVGDLEAAQRGLVVLAAGGRQAARADLDSFIEQRQETGGLWSAISELASTHPFLCKRVAALHERVHPGSMPPVGRNPLAYPLAPFLGFGSVAGGAGVSMLVMVAIIGIIAAIAIPSLLRARVSANEAAAIADIREVMAAQLAYAQANAGFPDARAECLSAPAQCIPGYPANGPSFVPEEVIDTPVRHGYRLELHPGSPARDEASYDSRRSSPSSSTSFAWVSTPLAPGQTGVRSFCGDVSGRICAWITGPADVDNGWCPPEPACSDLR